MFDNYLRMHIWNHMKQIIPYTCGMIDCLELVGNDVNVHAISGSMYVVTIGIGNDEVIVPVNISEANSIERDLSKAAALARRVHELSE